MSDESTGKATASAGSESVPSAPTPNGSAPVQAAAVKAVRPEYAQLDISADLLPQEIIDGRRVRLVRKYALAGIALAVLVISAGYGVAWHQTSVADGHIDSLNADTQRLNREQRAFADILAAQAETQNITGQLSKLLANDLPWSSLLSSLRAVAPEGVSLVGVFGTLSATAPTPGAAAQANDGQLPAKAGQRRIGTVTISGLGKSKEAVAGYADRLGTVKGLASPLLTEALQQEDGLRFSVRLDITDAALGGRYTSPHPSAPSGQPAKGATSVAPGGQ